MLSSSPKTRLTVGSSDQADIVINQPTVSRVHCRFDWNGQCWILEDLGSTNGTFVNAIRISEPTVLRATDKVTLGRGIVCDIPKAPSASAAQSSSTMTPSSQGKPTEPKPKSPRNLIIAIAGLSFAAVLTVIAVVAKNSSSKSAENTSQPTQNTTDSNAAKSSENPKVTADEQAKALPNPQSATWVALVESADGKTQKLLGTAIAIEPKKLVTLASLVYAADLVKDEYPKLRLVNLLNPQLSILSPKVKLHPNYTRAMESFGTLETEMAEKLKSINSLEEPTLEDKLKWSERYETVMEAISNADLAVIESDVALPSVLPIAQAKSLQTSESEECRLLGFPLITPSPQVSGNVKAFWLELQGQANARDLASRDYEVETVGVTTVSTVSLACVDANNQLLGIVTRQATYEGNSLKKVSKVVPVRLFD